MLGENKFNSEIDAAHEAFPTVPVAVIKAVIATESSFNPDAYNPEKGSSLGPSHGLMQLTIPTAEGLGYGGSVKNLFLPAINTYYGTALLAENYAKLGNWAKAVSMYNGGYRPELGFGERVVSAGVHCMGRLVLVGSFCNQQHVDRFLRHLQRFQETADVAPLPIAPAQPERPGRAGGGFWGLLALIGAFLFGIKREG